MHSGVLKITTQGSSQFHAIFAMMACIACQYHFHLLFEPLEMPGLKSQNLAGESSRLLSHNDVVCIAISTTLYVKSSELLSCIVLEVLC